MLPRLVQAKYQQEEEPSTVTEELKHQDET